MKTLEDCVDAALSKLTPAARAAFSVDPAATLRDVVELKVEQASHLTERRDDGGVCDGLSFLKDDVILYAPTPYSRRENFTLGHELGHWLVKQTPEIYDWLVDQPQPGRALETVCDAIAQRLLLAGSAIDAVLQGEPVQARHVLELYEHSNASIPVCAISLAARLPGLGGVVIVKRGDARPATVEYASVRPDSIRGWPKVYPWPGQVVPGGHPFALIDDRATVRRRSFWATPWGERADFYVDAVTHRDRCIAVMADTDLWGAERFHPDTPRDFDERPEWEVNCCGRTWKVRGYPCQVCGEVRCPKCGRCRCDRQNDELVMCKGGCFMMLRPNLLVDGVCEDCR